MTRTYPSEKTTTVVQNIYTVNSGASFPVAPSDGELFKYNGTVYPKGLYFYDSSTSNWVQL